MKKGYNPDQPRTKPKMRGQEYANAKSAISEKPLQDLSRGKNKAK